MALFKASIPRVAFSTITHILPFTEVIALWGWHEGTAKDTQWLTISSIWLHHP